MADCASGAEFFGPPPPNNRHDVRISAKMGGGTLKVHCSKDDVESKGVDASGKETPSKPAKSIIESNTGLQCEATLQHLANWEKVLVRIRCGDGSWSNWVEAKK